MNENESSCEAVPFRHAELKSQNIKQWCCMFFFLIQHQDLLVESYGPDLMPTENNGSLVVGFRYEQESPFSAVKLRVCLCMEEKNLEMS